MQTGLSGTVLMSNIEDNMPSICVFDDLGGMYKDATSIELALNSDSKCRNLSLLRLWRLTDNISLVAPKVMMSPPWTTVNLWGIVSAALVS